MARLKSFDELKKEFNRIAKSVPKESKRIVGIIGLRAVGNIKKVTPVDTGELRNSIHSKVLNESEVVIGTTKEYAPHVEYGTRRGIVGQYYMKRGINQTEEELPELLEELIKRVVR